MEMKAVYCVKDDSGHWYVIPFEMKKDFEKLLSDAESDYDAADEFDLKFRRYRTGGDLNLVQLYAEI